ncbi:MAG: flagellar hook basal-body protein [Gemmatimonadetes bacterium]|nr:flagellar hook basal-body protein [Gemmatimonadota bacterium]
MPDPVRTAAQGLRYWEHRQQAVANNLANVSTAGFKREQVFAQLVDGPGPTGGGAADLTEGARQETGRPLDLALEGEGYFVVRTPAGNRYTRNGAFSLDADGVLVDRTGNPVLGSDGQSIVLPPGSIEVRSDGEIMVDGASLGRFRIDAAPPGRLEREGGVFFVPPPGDPESASDRVRVHQGQLEESNVNSVSAMVDMITIQRNHAALQRTLTVADGIDGRIANDIARVE